MDNLKKAKIIALIATIPIFFIVNSKTKNFLIAGFICALFFTIVTTLISGFLNIRSKQSKNKVTPENKSNKEMKCPKCGYLLPEPDWRCPECYCEFDNYDFDTSQLKGVPKVKKLSKKAELSILIKDLKNDDMDICFEAIQKLEALALQYDSFASKIAEAIADIIYSCRYSDTFSKSGNHIVIANRKFIVDGSGNIIYYSWGPYRFNFKAVHAIGNLGEKAKSAVPKITALLEINPGDIFQYVYDNTNSNVNEAVEVRQNFELLQSYAKDVLDKIDEKKISDIVKDDKISKKFSLKVTSTMDAGDYIMVAGVLQTGQKPQKGDQFCILRNNKLCKIGTIKDSIDMGDTLGAMVQAGASVTVLGSSKTLKTQVSFTTSDLNINDIQKGDQIESL